MGAARNRGPREVRVVEGAAKREAVEKARLDEIEARERALTPEERASRFQAQQLIATMMGVTMGMSLGSSRFSPTRRDLSRKMGPELQNIKPSGANPSN